MRNADSGKQLFVTGSQTASAVSDNIVSVRTKIETNNGGIQMKTLIVKETRCPQNHPCPSVRVCPTGALTQEGCCAPRVDTAKCIACGRCVITCPMRALTLE